MGIYIDQGLLGVLAATHRRNTHSVALDNLQQRLLYTLATDIAGDGWACMARSHLIALIEHDDTQLSLLDVVVASTQKAYETVFDVGTYISRLGDLGTVLDIAGHVQNICYGTNKERLARARMACKDDVGLLDTGGIGMLLVVENSLVVIGDGYTKGSFGLVLADDILVEFCFEFLW